MRAEGIWKEKDQGTWKWSRRVKGEERQEWTLDLKERRYILRKKESKFIRGE